MKTLRLTVSAVSSFNLVAAITLALLAALVFSYMTAPTKALWESDSIIASHNQGDGSKDTKSDNNSGDKHAGREKTDGGSGGGTKMAGDPPEKKVG